MSTAKFNTWLNPDGTENYKCRAWVNFDGTNTPAIRASGNVTSITDNGVGDYTANFTTAMPDANYAVTAVGNRDLGSTIFNRTVCGPFTSAPTTTAFRVRTGGWGVSEEDFEYVNLSFFR